MRQVYLDYAATTPVKEEVFNEMKPYFTQVYGNPSSLYSMGLASKEAIATARKQVADSINAGEKELFFTSCGTEADNWAIFGIADAKKDKGNHIITTKIEHHAILHSCEYLEKRGYDITYLDVNNEGLVEPKDLEDAITEKTVLISVMLVNNEVGSVQPIKELAAIAKKHKIIFHTDAVQGLGNIDIDVKDMDVDLLSISSHKIYGPKGIGALYIRKGLKISNYLHGGAQENKKRAGTENLPCIVGFGKAAQLAKANFKDHVANTTQLRDYLIKQVTANIKNVAVNGSMEHRHPGNANITFEFIEGEAILLYLDMLGISVSTGSACSSASLTPSHVLSAMGIPVEKIHGTIRFTVGDLTTKEDIDYVVSGLKDVVNKLREISSVSSKKGW
ncbi:MAG: cysteine desulfurase NifS [Anaerovoracaceae bacterium]